MLVWFGSGLLLALIHQSQEKFFFPDNALRMLMATTLLAMVAKPGSKQWLLSGIVVAGVASAYWALQAWPWNSVSRAQGITNNPIHFGNLSAIVMMMAVTNILLTITLSMRIRAYLTIAAFGSLVGAIASLSRSSFLVVLCLLPLSWLATNLKLIKWVQRAVLITLGATVLAVLLSSTVREGLRVTEAISDFERIKIGNYGSSLGARAAMWKTAWLIFEEHPFVGVGAGEFQNEIVRRINAGEISETLIYNQPHSDIMHSLSSGGLLKFFSYLGILCAPFIFFYRRYREVGDNAESRLMPIMGMQVVGAYFLTGLTNSNFDLQIYSTTYAVLVCVLAKLSMQPESEP
jgi:O-antigen ligase